MKENEELEVTPEIEEVLAQTVPPKEEKKETLADVLSSKEFEKTVDTLIDEKLKLADEADDGEELIAPEDEEKEKKGFGVFPLVVFGVLGLGVVTLLLTKNSPDTAHNDDTEQYHG